MRIWRAIQGSTPPVCKRLGLEGWRRGGGKMLHNYPWIEVRLLNLNSEHLILIAEGSPPMLIILTCSSRTLLIKHYTT